MYITRKLKKKFYADFLAVMADETTDVSSQFQLSVILRYVKNGNPIERFWGFLLPSDHDARH